jgi:hypothetical protein
MPQEKISMDMENMLLKLHPKEAGNIVEELPVTKTVTQQVKLDSETQVVIPQATDVPKDSENDISNVLSPISYNNSTIMTPMTTLNGRRQLDLDESQQTDGMSTTVKLHNNQSGNSTTFLLDKDLTLLEGSSPEQGSTTQILKDPLNLSNVTAEQEEKLKNLKVHKFRVNGRKAEMNLEQKERSVKTTTSKRGRQKKFMANLDLQEKIPVPKVLLEMPKPGENAWWGPKEIVDIRDSIMGSTRGYDLRVQWEYDENGKPYEDSWEPSDNITGSSGYLFNRFKKTDTFKDYMVKRTSGKVEEPVPKPKKVRWKYEEDPATSPVKGHKIDENLAGKTRSGKTIGGIWKRNEKAAFAINIGKTARLKKHQKILQK